MNTIIQMLCNDAYNFYVIAGENHLQLSTGQMPLNVDWIAQFVAQPMIQFHLLVGCR